jgi:hypothetical protein
MSWPYLHTLVNHFPIVLTVVGAIGVLLAAMIQRRAIWVYATSTLTLAGLTIYPAWLTGGRAGGAVRNAWYIQHGAIHTHAVAAQVTLWVVGVTGFLAFVALVTMIRTGAAVTPARWLRVLVGLGALASICAVSYTGFLGGKIVVESPILMNPTPPIITVPVPGAITAPSTTTPPALPSTSSPATSSPASATLTQQTPPAQQAPAPQTHTP